MQLWMEINVVTLNKVVETMPQEMCSVIKAKKAVFCKRQLFFFFYCKNIYYQLEIGYIGYIPLVRMVTIAEEYRNEK